MSTVILSHVLPDIWNSCPHRLVLRVDDLLVRYEPLGLSALILPPLHKLLIITVDTLQLFQTNQSGYFLSIVLLTRVSQFTVRSLYQ